ncbi:hypothetical protein Y032_0016g2958 [Ancylostoma ceylanicum]|uniref:Receptor L-domain domain-containing protein n=1 Tax=Ancylostoma ceylanicum TaxID=53326 RepID=A0A016V5R0_9BILA|nr:hypothetical protein Y032_0016g2958 [Ancylostoma ceylanicum]
MRRNGSSWCVEPGKIRTGVNTARRVHDDSSIFSAACGDLRNKSGHCRIIEGTLIPEDPRNLDLQNLEELYGRFLMSKTLMVRLPHMPKLKKIEWMGNSKFPAITIESNPNLESIAELARLQEIVLGPGHLSVEIRDNPKLCIEPEYMQTKFVKQYARHIRECGIEKGMRSSNFKGSSSNAQANASGIPTAYTAIILGLSWYVRKI